MALCDRFHKTPQYCLLAPPPLYFSVGGNCPSSLSKLRISLCVPPFTRFVQTLSKLVLNSWPFLSFTAKVLSTSRILKLASKPFWSPPSSSTNSNRHKWQNVRIERCHKKMASTLSGQGLVHKNSSGEISTMKLSHDEQQAHLSTRISSWAQGNACLPWLCAVTQHHAQPLVKVWDTQAAGLAYLQADPRESPETHLKV